MEKGFGIKLWWTPETPAKPTPHHHHPTPLVNGNGDGKDNGADELHGYRTETNLGSQVFVHSDDEDVNTKNGGTGDDPLVPPTPSKKRKRDSKEPKKKSYRPRILLDESQKKSKTTPKKGKAKADKTPKASTPRTKSKSKSNFLRRTRVANPTLKPSLLPSFNNPDGSSTTSFVESFEEQGPSSAFFPFLPNLEQIETSFDSHTSGLSLNSLGSLYNSLGTHSSLPTLLNTLLLRSRRVGPNFPDSCKRKRLRRWWRRLETFLVPCKKGLRSNSFVRKKKAVFDDQGMSVVVTKTMESLIMRIRSARKKNLKERKGRKRKLKMGNEVILYNHSNQLVLHKGRKKSHKELQIEVDLDEETLRMWSLIKDGNEDYQDSDEEKQKYWERERHTIRCTVKRFTDIMHMILGDRTFTPWKGSVLDSVVGAYLTQNVSDHLSSSAYMSLASMFPLKTNASEQSCIKDIEEMGTPISQESVGSSDGVFPGPELAKELENIKDVDVEALKAEESTKEEMKALKEVDKEIQERWDTLREKYTKSTKKSEHVDSVDWEAVRCVKVEKIAKAIASRGQHNIIAGRVKGLLNELKEKYGVLDLEWLRDAPAQDAKEYLLHIYGVGLKSVECIRLLTLQKQAFPVDVNVGRIAVRLGWVPLQPLPEDTELHNLEKYPLFDSIQKFLWPRLCKMTPLELYQFHYQLITFGKVFCTKRNPNCHSCPMKNECRHFASASASAKAKAEVALPALEENISKEESEWKNPTPETISEVIECSTKEKQQEST